MIDRERDSGGMLSGKMHWFMGVVEDLDDPLLMGRVRVRIWGVHEKESVTPRSTLPWATVMTSAQSAGFTGIGWAPSLYILGAWVVGFFQDGDSFQNPIILGSILSMAGPPISGWPEDRAVNRQDILDSVDLATVPVDQDFLAYLASLEEACGLPSGTLYGVMMTESGGNPNAVSPAGAKGLFQLMPGTASDMGVKDVFDPYDNARGGAKYLCIQYKKYGNLDHALMAYNWGPGNVDRWLANGADPSKVPNETRNYVPRVKAHAAQAPDVGALNSATGTYSV